MYIIYNYLGKTMRSFIISLPTLFAWFHIRIYSSADHNVGCLPVQMWQHETFIHFGYITVDIIGCVDGKYEHNSVDATCQDFVKIPLRSPLSVSLSNSLPSRIAPTIIVSSSLSVSLLRYTEWWRHFLPSIIHLATYFRRPIKIRSTFGRRMRFSETPTSALRVKLLNVGV